MMCYTFDMKKKHLFAVILLIMMAAVQLPAEGITFLEGYDIQIGPDTDAGNGEYYSCITRDSTVVLPYFTKTGFSRNLTQKQALACLLQAEDSYVTTSYEPENRYVVLWAFLKDNPDYSLQLNYDAKGVYRGCCVQYDDTHSLFYQKYQKLDETELHREQWERLPDIDRQICAFSCDFPAAYHYSVYTVKLYTDMSPLSVLRDNWNASNKQELIHQLDLLYTRGHHGNYNRLVALLDKYPGLSALEIAKKELLDDYETLRLHYVQETYEQAGSHGIEAWDYGRALYLIREGYELNWLTLADVHSLSARFLERCLNDYASWEDFMAHYALGRGWYGLSDYEPAGSQKASLRITKKIRTEGFIPSLAMPGNNGDNPALAMETSLYEPSQEFLSWKQAMLFFEDNTHSTQELLESASWLEQYEGLPAIHMLRLRAFFNAGLHFHTLHLFRDAEPFFACYEDQYTETYENGLYEEFYSDWAIIANNYKRSDDALHAISMLHYTDEGQTDMEDAGFACYQSGIAYLNLIGTGATFEENNGYYNLARQDIERAVAYGVTVPESLITYLGLGN